jgi:hypothetical protein
MKAVGTANETWRQVEANVNFRIAQLRDALERHSDETTTADLRGQLKAFRSILEWPLIGAHDDPEEGIALI